MRRWNGVWNGATRVGLIGLVLGPVAWAQPGFEASLGRLETRLAGRVGVFAIRGETTLGHRAGERFAYCSSFKWVLGAAILQQVDRGHLSLDQPVPYSQRDLLSTSPITAPRVGEGRMSVGDLCNATITTSDNTAANLLEPLIGGPAGLQAFVRGLGDLVMRCDRMELALNSNRAGDRRDTTSPEAMARLLKTVMETGALSAGSRERLLGWMKGTVTGKDRIPAGVPKGWTVAHKTGTSGNGAVNDVAVLLPPEGSPIYLCVFTNSRRAGDAALESAIAEVTRQVVAALP